MLLDDQQLTDLAARLVELPGVVPFPSAAAGLGRAICPNSDVDLGLYYRHSIDVATLGHLARAVGGPTVEVTKHGEWGPSPAARTRCSAAPPWSARS